MISLTNRFRFLYACKRFVQNEPIRVINKYENMGYIRNHIRKHILDKNKGKTNESYENEFYIGLIHTYPAWSGRFHEFVRSGQWRKIFGNSGFAENPYGHTLCEFFRYDKGKLTQDIVMNVGTRTTINTINKKDFIHFIPSSLYHFNTEQENTYIAGNQQNGMPNRTFITINIRVNEETYVMLLNYYENIKKTNMCNERNKKFTLATYILANKLRKYNPFVNMDERGNCCYWTSKGFVANDLLVTNSDFPLVCFYKFLINIIHGKTNYFKNNDTSYHITLYKALNYDKYPKGSLLYPLFWLKHGYSVLWTTEQFAETIVELEPTYEGSSVYTTKITDNTEDTSEFRKRIMNTVNYLDKILF